MLLFFLVVTATTFAQDTTRYKVINGAETLYFNTQAEHDAWVAQHSPTPDMTEIILDQKRELIGKDAMRSLIKAIRTQVTNTSDRIVLAKLLTPVFMLLGDGFIQDARDIANAEATTTVYTAGRKAFVLGEIDKALTAVTQ